MRAYDQMRVVARIVRAWRAPQPAEVTAAADATFAVMVAEGVEPDRARRVSDELAGALADFGTAISACHPQADRVLKSLGMIEEMADEIASQGDGK